MYNVWVKPLSANRLWRGRKFKTPEYDNYRANLLIELPAVINVNPHALQSYIPEKCPLSLEVEFHVSNKSQDIDNCMKGFIDALQDKYKFNDSMIMEIVARKLIVKKGMEKIKFNLKCI